MILDSLLQLADAQSSTVSVASTNIVDTLAAGDAYVGCWFVAAIDTAFTASAGAPSIYFQLQTSSDGFLGVGNDVTLAQSATYTVGQLTAGKYWAVRIPLNVKRYLRGYRVGGVSGDSSNIVSAGKHDMFIVSDIDSFLKERYAL